MKWLALLFAFVLLPAQEPPPDKAVISGVVVRTNTDQPIENVRVELKVVSLAVPRGDAWPIQPEPVLTDDEGRFEFRNLPAGRYRVNWERSGYFHPPLEAGGSLEEGPYISTRSRSGPSLNVYDHLYSERGRRGVTVNLTEKQVRTIALPLTQGGVITGTVLDARGRPLSGSMVVPFRIEQYELGDPILLDSGSHAVADDRGNYRLYGLQPGNYYIRTDSRFLPTTPDIAPYSYYPNGTLAAAMPVTVSSGSESRSVTFIGGSVPAATISGTLTIAVPKLKLQDAFVTFFVISRGRGPKDPLPMILPNSVTNASDSSAGKFKLTGILPGDYDVYALISNEDDTLTDIDYFAGRAAVTVTSQGAQDLSIVVGAGARIQGRVRLTDGAKTELQNLHVSIEPWAAVYPSIHATTQWQKVGPDGAFEFSGMLGHRYRVSLSDLPPAAAVSDIRQGNKSVFADGIVVENGGDSIEIVVTGATGSVEVQVTDAEHRAATGATITLIPADQRGNPALFDRSSFNEAESRYHPMTGILPGEYLLFAWDEIADGAEMNEEFLSKFVDRGVRVVVQPHQTIRTEALLIQ